MRRNYEREEFVRRFNVFKVPQKVMAASFRIVNTDWGDVGVSREIRNAQTREVKPADWTMTYLIELERRKGGWVEE